MQILWEHVNTKQYVDVVLIQCYSGWRPQELGLLKLENINLDDWTFTGGMKTAAGTDRIVPIHPRLRPLVEKRYQEAVSLGSEYLINCPGARKNRSDTRLTYDKYKKRFIRIRDELGLDARHRTHDGRMHFVTMAKKYGVDEFAIKYIVGHAINDITEKVYTRRELDWLKSEIEKIK
jgi:integrase